MQELDSARRYSSAQLLVALSFAALLTFGGLGVAGLLGEESVGHALLVTFRTQLTPHTVPLAVMPAFAVALELPLVLWFALPWPRNERRYRVS